LISCQHLNERENVLAIQRIKSSQLASISLLMQQYQYSNASNKTDVKNAHFPISAGLPTSHMPI
jgi:hypothetical protein